MAATDDITAFAQSVYLIIKNRYYDDIGSTDGQAFIAQIVDFANQFIDELENELDGSGNPINWWWLRQNGATLGSATTGNASVNFDSDDFLNLIPDEGRYVQILQDGTAVSNWAVVQPSDISNAGNRVTEDMCARVGDNLVFSRAFKSTENNGTIVGDVTTPITRLSFTGQANSDALSTVKPKQLLILGVAKNASLPDIVQGKLSPTFVQKYNDLLTNAVARSASTSLSDTVQRDNLGYISGVGF